MLNLFFDSDCPWFLINYETGDQRFGSYGGRNIVHPNIANFIHPLVKLVSQIPPAFHLDPAQGRVKEIAISVAPTFAAIRSSFLFLALSAVGFSIFDALLLTALSIVSFSGMLFGALPESFGISGALFAFAFYLLAMTIRQARFERISWLIAATLMFGTTITNVVPFTFLMAVAHFSQTKNFRQTIRQLTVILASAGSITAFFFIVLTALHGSFRGTGLRHIGQMEEIRVSGKSAVILFPKALLSTIIPPEPHKLLGRSEDGDLKGEAPSNDIRVRRFTYRDDLDKIIQDVPTLTGVIRGKADFFRNIVVALLYLLSFFISLFSFSRLTSGIRIFVISAWSQILFHWTFHSFFGNELFLYSQHWLIPLVIVMGVGLTARFRLAWLARSVIAILVVGAIVQNTSVFQLILTSR